MTNTPKKNIKVDLGEIDITLSSSEVATNAVDATQSVADSTYSADAVNLASSGFFGIVQQVSGINVLKQLSWDNLKIAIKAYLDGFYQTSLGFTPENIVNKENSIIDSNTDKYPTVNLLNIGLNTKQATLQSGTNIKTINSNSILGAGDLVVGQIWDKKIQSDSPLTVAANDNFLIYATSDYSLLLPASPSEDDIVNVAFNPSSDTINLNVSGNGNNIDGFSTSQLQNKFKGFFIYDGSQWLFFYQVKSASNTSIFRDLVHYISKGKSSYSTPTITSWSCTEII